jgi:hypothetical protein
MDAKTAMIRRLKGDDTAGLATHNVVSNASSDRTTTPVKIEVQPKGEAEEEEEEEEEFIDEGERTFVPWGAPIGQAVPSDDLEEEEGVYSEDEVVITPGKYLCRYRLTDSAYITSTTISARKFDHVRTIRSRSAAAGCSSRLPDHADARHHRCSAAGRCSFRSSFNQSLFATIPERRSQVFPRQIQGQYWRNSRRRYGVSGPT